ncbi:MAG: redoxin domain-containing protein [Solirubrobacterales bacterium]|nr:redoxin domain-containing protein [Solirubrobacterales bacterium]MBV9472092.1 redoxin domain-containing protein [Solirubrobacterales bacterium]
MRAPVDHIAAPVFPSGLAWINSDPLRVEELLGRPMLVEFWDFCRANSIRTLPYLEAWHERYAAAGLQLVGVHSSGFDCSGDPHAVKDAVARLSIAYPVVVDVEHEIWRSYGNLGWPARYLFDERGVLFDYHYGEGGYEESELAIQQLLGCERPTLPPLRPEDAPGALLAVQSDDVQGVYSGPYEAGGVWAVLDGRGSASVNGRELTVDHPGCYELIHHAVSTAGRLELTIGAGVRCHAVCFTPGLAR